jgi:transcriptional regulator with XRE-family HTH domain
MGTPIARADSARRTLGELLREWRGTRGVSQFELALRAGFSSRHVSFIETGRTQASRQAVLILAEALDVPLRERNRLLEAAGYAHVYRHTPLAAEEMSHVRGVLQFLLDRHEPYAAIVLDRYSNCLMGNRASARIVAALVGPSLIGEHANHLRGAAWLDPDLLEARDGSNIPAWPPSCKRRVGQWPESRGFRMLRHAPHRSSAVRSGRSARIADGSFARCPIYTRSATWQRGTRVQSRARET